MAFKIAWITDPHLNFLEKPEREEFYSQIKELKVSGILMTGDIAESKDICSLLNEFSANLNQPIYFVLGNHDYYFSNVVDVRAKIQYACSLNKNLNWLGLGDIVRLNESTVLVGHDGWADARYGDFDQSTVRINDSRLIGELYQAFLVSKSALKSKMQKLADADAVFLAKTINEAIDTKIKNVIVATHVPPFPECCWHQNQPSDSNWLPFFSSKATGDALKSVAKKYDDVNFLTLCGHTHSEMVIQVADNLVVKTGKAEYYQPMIQEVISF